MCLMARDLARRISSGLELLASLSACHVENVVQWGEPITMKGLSRLNIFRALFLFPLLEKSHSPLDR